MLGALPRDVAKRKEVMVVLDPASSQGLLSHYVEKQFKEMLFSDSWFAIYAGPMPRATPWRRMVGWLRSLRHSVCCGCCDD